MAERPTLSCAICKEKPFTVPLSEEGASLIKRHLRDEHEIGFLASARECPDCGAAVLVDALADPPAQVRSCADHG